MIDATNTDSFITRQDSLKDTRKDNDPAAFAKTLKNANEKSDNRNEKSNNRNEKPNNRRETTGRTADDPLKGHDRKEWAHKRSRAESKSKAEDNVQNEIPDVAHSEQDQSLGAEYNLLMWFFDMPVELNEAIDLLSEGHTMISEETMKSILLWMQSMPEVHSLPEVHSIPEVDSLLEVDSLPEVDNLPKELSAIIEKTQELLQIQNDMSKAPLSIEQKTELTAILEQIKSLVEANVEDDSPKESVQQESNLSVLPVAAAEEASKNIHIETGAKNEVTKKPEVAFLGEFSTDKGTSTEDLTMNFSDHHFNKKDTATPDTPAEFIAQEQPNETVIPFSLAQIDTLLQQNTMIQELDQQQSQIQQEVLQQVIDKIQVTHGANQSFVTLHLVPEHLGKLIIQLTSDVQQGMTARIYAETPHAKEMIESNFGQLKDALSGKGVNLTAMEVFVGQDPESSEKQREFQYQQARAQRRRGSRTEKASNTGQTAIISEIPIVNNPYMQTEGFDQLG